MLEFLESSLEKLHLCCKHTLIFLLALYRITKLGCKGKVLLPSGLLELVIKIFLVADDVKVLSFKHEIGWGVCSAACSSTVKLKSIKPDLLLLKLHLHRDDSDHLSRWPGRPEERWERVLDSHESLTLALFRQFSTIFFDPVEKDHKGPI